ncbi:MAG TPA: sucrase ferredoxin [Pyrinomonadaceae bacterium]|jgi:hypothetical protein
MSLPFFYCSELSRGVAEKAYGTASVGDFWMLVEYPMPWRPRAFQESTLSASVKSHLNRVLKSVPRSRLLFIKRERTPPARLTFFLVRCRESAPYVLSFKLENYAQLLDIDLASVAAGRGDSGGTLEENPLYLVCTHGKRDKCCAKFGYPLYKSLKAERDGSVWQSSHVGGDRFAANLICFPHGLFYAHVTEEAGRHIVSEYEQGRMTTAGYRGRACYSYPVQAAEFFVRTEAKLTAIEELRHLDCARVGDKSWRVRFSSAASQRIHEARVTSRLAEFQNFITCQSSEEQRVNEYVLDDYRVTTEP